MCVPGVERADPVEKSEMSTGAAFCLPRTVEGVFEGEAGKPGEDELVWRSEVRLLR